MATPSYTYSIDTLVSTTLDAYSGDPINLITKSGEKFLNTMRNSGRIFYVKDCEKIRHPLLIGHGENSSYYKADQLDGEPSAGGTGGAGGILGVDAVEILTQANFEMHAATRNINMPQSMPPGDVIDYVDTLVRANLLKIWNEEEKLFWMGRGAGGTQTAISRAPFTGDTENTSTTFLAGHPMSLLSLMGGSTTNGGTGATDDQTDEAWAGVKTDDVGDEWMPQHFDTAGSGADLVADLQSSVDLCGFSEDERVTHIFTSRAVYEKMLDLLRDKAALPDPIFSDWGASYNHFLPFGGLQLQWSRYLEEAAQWNISGTAAVEPIFGLNLNSLRMNVVMNESPIDGDLGYIRQIGDGTYPHPTLTNVFKRIEWKRNYSVDNGRRSMFLLSGVTGLTS